MSLILALLSFIGAANAVCTAPEERDPNFGTLIRDDQDCSVAVGPAFGFHDIEGAHFDLGTMENYEDYLDVEFDNVDFDSDDEIYEYKGMTGISVPLMDHGFTKICRCSPGDTCDARSVSANNCANGYVIPTADDGRVCVQFGGSGLLPDAADSVIDGEQLHPITGAHLSVTIDGRTFQFTRGAVATSNRGAVLRALVLHNGANQGVLFSACGPFVLQDGVGVGDRKRDLGPAATSVAPGVHSSSSMAVGDPHLAGAHGIKFDVFGAPGGVYSLVVAPAFEVNMQLAKHGPELRFMTAMTVLFRGKSFTIEPWTAKAKRAELVAHFESLGSKISIKDDRVITIELCAGHTIAFAVLHIERNTYLNFRMEVPGCHDSYGGLLGQTYQCKFASQKFNWSREREEEFRIATLETPSGSYSPNGDCLHEDAYRGGPMNGASFSNGTLSMATMR